MIAVSDDDYVNAPYRFLIVDHPDVARDVQLPLKGGETVVVETDPALACQRVADADRQGAQFDVVLCRFDIDATYGESLYRATRACSRPTIFIHMARHCDEAGEWPHRADGILIKPFTGQEVEDLMVKIVMEHSRAHTRQMLLNDVN